MTTALATTNRAERRWYFSKEEVLNSPSSRCGINAEKELSYRQQSASLIQDMGQRLQVGQLVINTAIVYMHRFYMMFSFQKFHRNSITPSCIFLAAKVEEQPRKLEHVMKVTHIVINGSDAPPLETGTDAYTDKANEIVVNENILLQTLGFDVAIDHPHTHVVKCCQLVRATKDLAQTSYFMATNSLHLTTFCLQYKPTVVACLCIFLVCKWSRYEIQRQTEGHDWFYYVDQDVTMDLLASLCTDFIRILDKCPLKVKKLIKNASAPGRIGCGSGGSQRSSIGGLADQQTRQMNASNLNRSLPAANSLNTSSNSSHNTSLSANYSSNRAINLKEYNEKREKAHRERERLAAAASNTRPPPPTSSANHSFTHQQQSSHPSGPPPKYSSSNSRTSFAPSSGVSGRAPVNSHEQSSHAAAEQAKTQQERGNRNFNASDHLQHYFQEQKQIQTNRSSHLQQQFQQHSASESSNIPQKSRSSLTHQPTGKIDVKPDLSKTDVKIDPSAGKLETQQKTEQKHSVKTEVKKEEKEKLSEGFIFNNSDISDFNLGSFMPFALSDAPPEDIFDNAGVDNNSYLAPATHHRGLSPVSGAPSDLALTPPTRQSSNTAALDERNKLKARDQQILNRKAVLASQKLQQEQQQREMAHQQELKKRQEMAAEKQRLHEKELMRQEEIRKKEEEAKRQEKIKMQEYEKQQKEIQRQQQILKQQEVQRQQEAQRQQELRRQQDLQMQKEKEELVRKQLQLEKQQEMQRRQEEIKRQEIQKEQARKAEVAQRLQEMKILKQQEEERREIERQRKKKEEEFNLQQEMLRKQQQSMELADLTHTRQSIGEIVSSVTGRSNLLVTPKHSKKKSKEVLEKSPMMIGTGILSPGTKPHRPQPDSPSHPSQVAKYHRNTGKTVKNLSNQLVSDDVREDSAPVMSQAYPQKRSYVEAMSADVHREPLFTSEPGTSTGMERTNEDHLLVPSKKHKSDHKHKNKDKKKHKNKDKDRHKEHKKEKKAKKNKEKDRERKKHSIPAMDCSTPEPLKLTIKMANKDTPKLVQPQAQIAATPSSGLKIKISKAVIVQTPEENHDSSSHKSKRKREKSPDNQISKYSKSSHTKVIIKPTLESPKLSNASPNVVSDKGSSQTGIANSPHSDATKSKLKSLFDSSDDECETVSTEVRKSIRKDNERPSTEAKFKNSSSCSSTDRSTKRLKASYSNNNSPSSDSSSDDDCPKDSSRKAPSSKALSAKLLGSISSRIVKKSSSTKSSRANSPSSDSSSDDDCPKYSSRKAPSPKALSAKLLTSISSRNSSPTNFKSKASKKTVIKSSSTKSSRSNSPNSDSASVASSKASSKGSSKPLASISSRTSSPTNFKSKSYSKEKLKKSSSSSKFSSRSNSPNSDSASVASSKASSKASPKPPGSIRSRTSSPSVCKSKSASLTVSKLKSKSSVTEKRSKRSSISPKNENAKTSSSKTPNASKSSDRSEKKSNGTFKKTTETSFLDTRSSIVTKPTLSKSSNRTASLPRPALPATDTRRSIVTRPTFPSSYSRNGSRPPSYSDNRSSSNARANFSSGGRGVNRPAQPNYPAKQFNEQPHTMYNAPPANYISPLDMCRNAANAAYASKYPTYNNPPFATAPPPVPSYPPHQSYYPVMHFHLPPPPNAYCQQPSYFPNSYLPPPPPSEHMLRPPMPFYPPLPAVPSAPPLPSQPPPENPPLPPPEQPPPCSTPPPPLPPSSPTSYTPPLPPRNKYHTAPVSKLVLK